MTYRFSGTPQALMTACLEHLAQARQDDGPDGQAWLHLALAELVGLHHLAAASGAPDAAALQAFRRDSLAALLGLQERVGFFLNETLLLAESARDDEWPALCMQRSAIQCLLDDYPSSPVPALFDPGEVAELDEEMRRVGDQQGPLDPGLVPRGLPAGHWWWRYPTEAAPEAGHGVLDPELGYDALARTLAAAGWRPVDVSRQPLVAGEPEFATFEHDRAGRLSYSFNPVCRLRLVQGPSSQLGRLPLVREADVLAWLDGPDERTLLRGILAARQMPAAALLARLELLRGHAHASLAKAAAEAAEAVRMALAGQPAPEAGEAAARGRAMQAIALLEHQLEPLLRALGQDRDGRLAAGLVPRPEDYALAFRPDAAAAARAAYAALWSSPPRPAAAPAGSRLEMHVAPAGMLADANELSRAFPGGYRAIAHLLDPHRVWVAWKLIPPGQDAGMAYDGLVWLDDHWAWFPKPYRMLASLRQDTAPPA